MVMTISFAQDKRRKAMDVSEQKAATKNFLRSMTQQQQERQMEEALVNERLWWNFLHANKHTDGRMLS